MSKLQDINYQPLNAMDHAWGNALKASFKGKYIAAWFGLIAVVSLGVLANLLQLSFIAIFLFFGVITSMVQVTKNRIWIQFAVANGWSLDTTVMANALVPYSLQFGHSQHYSPIITAVIENINCDVFTYNTTTGSGKYQETHYFTVAEVTVPKVLPHMVLRSKRGKSADMQDDFADHQTLQLEGDFNDYFKLEIVAGQQVDALQVLTPDVMQRLVSYSQAEDIEIAENGLFFICASDRRDAKQMQQILTSVYELSTQIIENISLTTVQAPAPTATPPMPEVAVPPVIPIPTALV
jgi:hypothetical protein